MLGTREPEIYGHTRLDDINQRLTTICIERGHHLHVLQSNAEHELIERIHEAYNESVDFILINPAALSHTSIALRDALSAVSIPFVECHLSNVYQRENFRHHSYLSDLAEGVISGFGAYGYELALLAALEKLK